MKLFKCQHCGQVLYFENSSCLGCARKLGYVTDQVLLTAVDRAPDGTWVSTASCRHRAPLQGVRVRGARCLQLAHSQR
jgi:hypothetical protein